MEVNPESNCKAWFLKKQIVNKYLFKRFQFFFQRPVEKKCTCRY